MDKRGLQWARGTITAAGVTFGTVVATNMRRYIYKIKTANQFAGANQLQFGYDTAGVPTVMDYIEHATQYEMWNDPDELREDALPIYIIPAGGQPYGITDNGNCIVYILYEDSE